MASMISEYFKHPATKSQMQQERPRTVGQGETQCAQNVNAADQVQPPNLGA